MKLIQSEEQKEKKRVKRKDSLRDLWGNIKWTNIHITGVQKRTEELKRRKNDLKKKKIASNVPNMGKETAFQIQKDNTVPSKMNQDRLIKTLTYQKLKTRRES